MGLFAIPKPNSSQAEDPTQDQPKAAARATPENVDEARRRARLLHEAIHGTLQVMHRDFFNDEESLKIPSQSLEDVFSELEKTQQVTLRWLAVNTEAMDVDHKPQDEFEKAAAKALSQDKKEYEQASDTSYRYAGTIRLSARCLKCHVPDRKSLEDRAAALVITMPLKPAK